MLLSEKWKLILAGIAHKDIKIRNKSLFVNSRLHVHAVELELEHQPAPGDSTPVHLDTSAPPSSVQAENAPINANDVDSSGEYHASCKLTR